MRLHISERHRDRLTARAARQGTCLSATVDDLITWGLAAEQANSLVCLSSGLGVVIRRWADENNQPFNVTANQVLEDGIFQALVKIGYGEQRVRMFLASLPTGMPEWQVLEVPLPQPDDVAYRALVQERQRLQIKAANVKWTQVQLQQRQLAMIQRADALLHPLREADIRLRDQPDYTSTPVDDGRGGYRLPRSVIYHEQNGPQLKILIDGGAISVTVEATGDPACQSLHYLCHAWSRRDGTLSAQYAETMLNEVGTWLGGMLARYEYDAPDVLGTFVEAPEDPESHRTRVVDLDGTCP